MDTYFAPAERADKNTLENEITIANKSVVMTGLLKSMYGMLAILNDKRQVIAVNDTLLSMIGVSDPGEALGLRPGEMLSCVHAAEGPSGCGTAGICSSCGAAIAIVSSLGMNKPVERTCALTVTKDEMTIDFALNVKSHPVDINNMRFLLLFIQDITKEQQRAALERTFFHDINNMLTMLTCASELLLAETPSELAKTVHDSSLRVAKEIHIQSCLTKGGTQYYSPIWENLQITEILSDIRSFFQNHPASYKKNLNIAKGPKAILKTDKALLMRVLCNMIINAFEATEKDGLVMIWVERKKSDLSFSVWNALAIPKTVSERIFQRNFSTKKQSGRGIGTYSMKLFGEKVLGGRVNFSSSETGGTVFRLSLPE